ncbi:MAG: hypothetical protein J6386_10070 [Candidatus Synoicihabitans palmerolidicus]|nr:hypothetical protein [Candidatus Synoicihabitans palmerolidicus]
MGVLAGLAQATKETTPLYLFLVVGSIGVVMKPRLAWVSRNAFLAGAVVSPSLSSSCIQVSDPTWTESWMPFAPISAPSVSRGR